MTIYEDIYYSFCHMVSDFTVFQWCVFALMFVILWCGVAYIIKEILR